MVDGFILNTVEGMVAQYEHNPQIIRFHSFVQDYARISKQLTGVKTSLLSSRQLEAVLLFHEIGEEIKEN